MLNGFLQKGMILELPYLKILFISIVFSFGGKQWPMILDPNRYKTPIKSHWAPKLNPTNTNIAQDRQKSRGRKMVKFKLYNSQTLYVRDERTSSISIELKLIRNPSKREKKYPFAHAAEFTGLKLITSWFLKPKHKKLTLKIDDLFVYFLSSFRSDFLQLLISLRHHYHWRWIAASSTCRFWRNSKRKWGTDLKAIEGGFGGGVKNFWREINGWRRSNWKAYHHEILCVVLAQLQRLSSKKKKKKLSCDWRWR